MDGNLLVYLQPKSINGNWLRNDRCEMEDIFFELMNPFTNRRLQSFLETEINRVRESCLYGYSFLLSLNEKYCSSARMIWSRKVIRTDSAA